MASLRYRCNRWHVQIRKSGYPSVNKSFCRKADAQRWARETEIAIENGTIRTGAEQCLKTPLSEILTRYQLDISAHKAGRHVEQYIISHWLKSPLSALPIGSVKPNHRAHPFRAEVSPPELHREAMRGAKCRAFLLLDVSRG